MSIQDIKNQIVSNINAAISIDLSKLYFDGPAVISWNNLSPDDVKNFIIEMVNILSKLSQNINILNTVPYDQLNNLNNYLINITNDYNGNLNNIAINQVTSHHHNILQYFHNINSLLRSNDIYSEIKLIPKFEDTTKKLEDANLQLAKFKKEEFESAISLVNELLVQKVEFEDKAIKQSLGTFLNRANEHKVFNKINNFWTFKFSGQVSWLYGAMLMAAVIIRIVFGFMQVLEMNNGSISLGAVILRISCLVIPSYFMIFFINQFSYHKRMYELYSFKNTAMNMMTDLMKSNPNKSEDILRRGLDVLFSEPEIKEGSKYDKQLVSDLLGFVKDKIK